MGTKDGDRIVGKDSKTGSFINGKGEAMKFTKNSMSIYSTTPDKKVHSPEVHIDKNKTGGYTVTTKSGPDSKPQKSDVNCFLTTACMRHFNDDFDDNCEELTILRNFRDNYVAKDDIEHYYEIAPMIVAAIDAKPNNDCFYAFIYENIVKVCVNAIKEEDFDFAYLRYKNAVIALENEFVKPVLYSRFVKSLTF